MFSVHTPYSNNPTDPLPPSHNMFSDGTNPRPKTGDTTNFGYNTNTPVSSYGKIVDTVSRIRATQGLRGYSERAVEIVRHIGYVLCILGCVAVTSWAFSTSPVWRSGGQLMLYSIAFMLVCAVVGSVFYADQRKDIEEQYRQFVFGIVALPGTALALFMRLINSMLDTPNTDNDMFASILRGDGLGLLYVVAVLIPPAVFAKYVFGGLRTMNKSRMTDEEQMAAWMRQDGAQH
ncbi:MAG: hypothetical protein WDA77_12305 [Acidimicrobiia bacterium]